VSNPGQYSSMNRLVEGESMHRLTCSRDRQVPIRADNKHSRRSFDEYADPKPRVGCRRGRKLFVAPWEPPERSHQ